MTKTTKLLKETINDIPGLQHVHTTEDTNTEYIGIALTHDEANILLDILQEHTQ